MIKLESITSDTLVIIIPKTKKTPDSFEQKNEYILSKLRKHDSKLNKTMRYPFTIFPIPVYFKIPKNINQPADGYAQIIFRLIDKVWHSISINFCGGNSIVKNLFISKYLEILLGKKFCERLWERGIVREYHCATDFKVDDASRYDYFAPYVRQSKSYTSDNIGLETVYGNQYRRAQNRYTMYNKGHQKQLGFNLLRFEIRQYFDRPKKPRTLSKLSGIPWSLKNVLLIDKFSLLNSEHYTKEFLFDVATKGLSRALCDIKEESFMNKKDDMSEYCVFHFNDKNLIRLWKKDLELFEPLNLGSNTLFVDAPLVSMFINSILSS